jgi:tRNA(Ile)-lysidine synthase
MRGKYTLSVWNKINLFIEKNKLISKKDKILLGVSGGPDSMLMLHYFDKVGRYDFVVFHLNHGIRKEAVYDEKIVKDYCEKNSIEFISVKVDIPLIAKKTGDNLENVARKKRYEFFLKYAKKYGCMLVATAHNLDEHIETIILNLLRGTSIKGLCGIPVKRKISDKIYVVRPILCLKKDEIIKYLKENKLRYAIDKTNYDTTYTRNWIRHKLIPMIEKKQPNFGEHLIKISLEIEKLLNIVK